MTFITKEQQLKVINNLTKEELEELLILHQKIETESQKIQEKIDTLYHNKSQLWREYYSFLSDRLQSSSQSDSETFL